MSKSGFRKVNTIWPGSSISEFRLSLFRVFSFSFSSFVLLTFRVLNVFCFQVWVLASIHVSKCFICLPVHGNYNSSVFEAVCRSKVCEVSKLSTDVSLKLDMGNRMVVIKKLTNKYYLFYRDVMFLNHT